MKEKVVLVIIIVVFAFLMMERETPNDLEKNAYSPYTTTESEPVKGFSELFKENNLEMDNMKDVRLMNTMSNIEFESGVSFDVNFDNGKFIIYILRYDSYDNMSLAENYIISEGASALICENANIYSLMYANTSASNQEIEQEKFNAFKEVFQNIE